MKKKTEKELEEIVKERTKWRHFFEILKRKYVFIPLIILLVYLIDNPDITIVTWALKFFKRIAGIH